MHKHHIIPRHAGGDDDPSNLIELSIEEHAEAHKKLWEEHGKEEDRIAWLTLSGNIGKEEANKAAVAAAMKRPEVRAKLRAYKLGTKSPHSETAKANMRKPKSEQAKLNMRNGGTGKHHSTRCFGTFLVDGQVIQNITKWARENGHNISSIRTCINGERTYKGYRIQRA